MYFSKRKCVSQKENHIILFILYQGFFVSLEFSYKLQKHSHTHKGKFNKLSATNVLNEKNSIFRVLQKCIPQIHLPFVKPIFNGDKIIYTVCHHFWKFIFILRKYLSVFIYCIMTKVF